MGRGLASPLCIFLLAGECHLRPSEVSCQTAIEMEPPAVCGGSPARQRRGHRCPQETRHAVASASACVAAGAAGPFGELSWACRRSPGLSDRQPPEPASVPSPPNCSSGNCLWTLGARPPLRWNPSLQGVVLCLVGAGTCPPVSQQSRVTPRTSLLLLGTIALCDRVLQQRTLGDSLVSLCPRRRGQGVWGTASCLSGRTHHTVRSDSLL